MEVEFLYLFPPHEKHIGFTLDFEACFFWEMPDYINSFNLIAATRRPLAFATVWRYWVLARFNLRLDQIISLIITENGWSACNVLISYLFSCSTFPTHSPICHILRIIGTGGGRCWHLLSIHAYTRTAWDKLICFSWQSNACKSLNPFWCTEEAYYLFVQKMSWNKLKCLNNFLLPSSSSFQQYQHFTGH